MLHVKCHTSHVTRHTSHVTRHTSHVTPDDFISLSRLVCDGDAAVVVMMMMMMMPTTMMQVLHENVSFNVLDSRLQVTCDV